MNKCDHLVRDLENIIYSAPFIKPTGAKVDIDKGKTKIKLPMRNDFHHAAGAMHGTPYSLALDNAAFFDANSLVKDVFVLTTSFTTYITRLSNVPCRRALSRLME